MSDDELRWSRLSRKVVTAALLIAIAPSIPLLVVLIVLKVWELAWPVILVAIVALLGILIYQLVRAWRWRRW